MARKKQPTKTDRLEPPKSLAPGAASIFREIVGALSLEHFGAQDRHHLAAYAHAAWRHNAEMARDKKRMGTAEPTILAECVKVMARLGPQLRITPGSRIEPKTAASSGRRAASEMQPSRATGAGPDWRSELH